MSNKLFIITGHGAGDPGACGNGYQEYERVRTLAKRCKALGGDNVMVSEENRNYYKDNGITNLTLSKDWLLCEFHMDSSTSSSARGAHVIIWGNYKADAYDEKLAAFLSGILPGRSSTIVGRTNLANPKRAANKGYNYRLIEIGFISNATDVSIFNSKMDEIAKGILECFGVELVQNVVVQQPTNQNSQLYRVRKTWEDAKSQLGAYANLENAKKKCDENEGYSVFDASGKVVYTKATTSTTTDIIYRIRKTWADAGSQKGAYRNLESAKNICDQNPGYSVFDEDGNAVYTSKVETTTPPATEEPKVEEPKEEVIQKPEAPEAVDISPLKGFTKEQFIEYVGSLAKTDMANTGILASVTIAQAILESAWGQSELSLKANNLFGMKSTLSGNTWQSAWTGEIYAKWSNEEVNGQMVPYYSDFRAYATVAESIADHSAYLCGAKKGSVYRYEGLIGETDYTKAIQLIKDGGYATDSAYVSKVVNIIETYKLYEFDIDDKDEESENQEFTENDKVEETPEMDPVVDNENDVVENEPSDEEEENIPEPTPEEPDDEKANLIAKFIINIFKALVKILAGLFKK